MNGNSIMTLPFSDPGPQHNHRANWLGRYLSVQSVMDEQLDKVLQEASIDAEQALLDVKGETFSATVQRIQYNFALQAIRTILHGLFLSTGDIIRDNRKDAVSVAVDAAANNEKTFLDRIFDNDTDKQNYIDSLKQTAKRNVEATIARVYLSEKPLSQRVYKTEALATGQVRRLVNSSIARGDSAADIAKSVRSSIRPDVRGGIAYAAIRLGRTELNNAFHAQSIVEQEAKPWVDHMQWFLSKVHEPDNCLCEVYAKQKRFIKSAVPEKPHPNCRCYVVPILIDYTSFENNLLIGMYDNFLQHAA